MGDAGPLFWVLAGAGIAAAIGYGVFFLNRKPSLLRALVKTMFMAALSAAFIIAHAHPVLIVALVAAALGDDQHRMRVRNLPTSPSSSARGCSPAMSRRSGRVMPAWRWCSAALRRS